ncbi:hemerythrin domain-containing protein [Mycolicibacterium pulveris]|uniref:Hemerythrin n=1 Tax=Mycolicibacterium pulveris TaxID=36813 RepID=A0A7I7UUE4_MYCPV|nr:hemerythrin domain-containing protein [Mycolicibacterium pulveris]MCV6983803.1 hemerythrin domain-containing protein [Mycolicibacterium pulveris]BBY83686.1 hemerythrin [Mycolicibacterium pulveris]
MSATLSAALEHEHRVIDRGIEIFADGANSRAPSNVTAEQRDALVNAVEVLRRHIYLEEEYLFPPLRAAGMVGPVMVMVHEHAQMWPLLDQIEESLADGNAATAAQLCRELLAQLGSHNWKEERILYPQADDTLSAADRDELSELVATAQVPEDWVCHGAVKGDQTVS